MASTISTAAYQRVMAQANKQGISGKSVSNMTQSKGITVRHGGSMDVSGGTSGASTKPSVGGVKVPGASKKKIKPVIRDGKLQAPASVNIGGVKGTTIGGNNFSAPTTAYTPKRKIGGLDSFVSGFKQGNKAMKTAKWNDKTNKLLGKPNQKIASSTRKQVIGAGMDAIKGKKKTGSVSTSGMKDFGSFGIGKY